MVLYTYAEVKRKGSRSSQINFWKDLDNGFYLQRNQTNHVIPFEPSYSWNRWNG